MKKVHAIIPIWGKPYIDAFLQWALPALSSPGNLGGVPPDSAVSVHLVTRPEDAQTLDTAPGVVALRRFIPIRVVASKRADFTLGGYAAFNACYLDAMADAWRERAAVMLLTADQIWADGSLTYILDCAARGAKAVMTAGLRVLETITPALADELATPRGGVTPATLACLATEYLHPWDRALVHDAQNEAQPASFQLWNAPGAGILMRCLHLHPVYLELSGQPEKLSRTVDAGSLVRDHCPDVSRVHVIPTSAHAMHVSIAPPEQSAHLVDYPRGNWRAMANWALTMGISRHNLFYMRQSIRIISENADDPCWGEAEAKAAEFCDPLLAWLDNPLRLAYSSVSYKARNNPFLTRSRGLRAVYRMTKKRLHLEY